jgi:hypothetical protein
VFKIYQQFHDLVKVIVTLQLTVSWPVSLGVESHLGFQEQIPPPLSDIFGIVDVGRSL